jgi:hypothetical protein
MLLTGFLQDCTIICEYRLTAFNLETFIIKLKIRLHLGKLCRLDRQSGSKGQNEKHKNETVRDDGYVAFSVCFGVSPDKSGRNQCKN